MVLSWLLLCLDAFAVCRRSNDLAWVAALTLAVAIEKLLPRGERIAQFLGAGLILAGVLKIALN